MKSRSEQFVTACTTLPYPEVRDERGEDSVPELERLEEYVSAGKQEQAIEYGHGLMRHYPDSDIPPTAVGGLLIRFNRAEEVDEMLAESLPNVLRKYYLYSTAGQASLRLGQLANAVVWWSRSVIAQCHVIDYQAHLPFYHLAHVGIVLGSYEAAESLFSMTAAIEPDSPHISTTLEKRLEPLKGMWVEAPLLEVLDHIQDKYLHGREIHPSSSL